MAGKEVKVIVVVLAGGPGERLWPLSRPGHPKPLVEVGGESLLARACRRGRRIASKRGRVLLVAQEADRRRMREAVPTLLEEDFVGEPVRRDTAMAVLMAAELVAGDSSEDVLVTIPADHIMRDEDAFIRQAKRAVSLAADHDAICLLGATPTEPRPEFGYIVGRAASGVIEVERFVEKPSSARAEGLIRQGALWNMGVFVGRASTILAQGEAFAPEVARAAVRAAAALRRGDGALLRKTYREAPKTSFDRAVLEKTKGLLAVATDSGWSDLGTWRELARFARESGEPGGGLVWREPGAPPLQVLGLDGVIACSTPAGVLVTAPSESRSVRPLAQEGTPIVPEGARKVSKPWGSEFVWAETERYAGKLLFVKSGESLSLQYHERKLESMWVLSGTGVLEVEGEAHALAPGSTLTVQPGTRHRLLAETDLSVLEVSTPELDDVIRLEDRYGRIAHDEVAAGGSPDGTH